MHHRSQETQQKVLFFLSREDSCRNPRGFFPGEFCGGFSGGFFGAFLLGNRGKIHPKIHGKIQIRVWELRGQNPHCKDLPLIFWCPIAIADFGFSDCIPGLSDRPKRSTQTLTVIGTLGCVNLCSTKPPLGKRHPIARSEVMRLRSRSRSQLRSRCPVH